MYKGLFVTYSNLKANYLALNQKIGAFVNAPSKIQVQLMLFVFGITILSCGLMDSAYAQFGFGGGAGQAGFKYNDARLSSSANAILIYLEGSFGALVMVASGVGAILSAAFGQYRAALGLMVVALGSFTLRSLMSTFFNDINIRG
jgi:hypothetical protein